MRKFLIALAALVAVALPSGVPVAAQAGGDNAALAINTHDGKTVYRIAIKVSRNDTGVVTNTNIAFAYASCSDCQTYAIAFQAVLVTSSPTIAAPTNLAIAWNDQCDSCTTFADANQVTVTTDGPVHFTPLGNQTLASIRHDLHALKHEDLTLDELAARVNQLADQFTWVVTTQLVPAGNS
jgi:putative peptide zinc metalloprotease protein